MDDVGGELEPLGAEPLLGRPCLPDGLTVPTNRVELVEGEGAFDPLLPVVA